MHTNRLHRRAAWLAMGVGLLASAAATAQFADFELDWWTVDSGGWTFSSGGGFDLGGTVGQPDASVLSSGGFELLGGFWPAARWTPGDTNCDGTVNFADINAFITALSGYEEYNKAFPNCYWLNADCNGDGDVNFGDINPLVELLGGDDGGALPGKVQGGDDGGALPGKVQGGDDGGALPGKVQGASDL